jgi:hypothetical protein
MTGTDPLTVLQRAWAVLDKPRSADLATYPLDADYQGFRYRVAIDFDGHRHVLVPAPGETLSGDGRPSALAVAVRTLTVGDGPCRYVDVRCADGDLHPEFDEVVADVLEGIQSSDPPGAAALRVIERWRRLFRARPVRGLSGHAVRGLFGEMVLLRSLLEHHPGLPLSVWAGPLGFPHDFEAPNRCVEVKVRGEDGDFVVVHGLEQLDRHDGRPLDLAVLTVVEDRTDGTTLGEVVAQVRSMVDDTAGLDRLLGRAGWTPDAARVSAEPLAVSSLLRVSVTETTPRLVPASLVGGVLPSGISHLTYRLDYGELSSYGHTAGLDELARDAG